MACAYVFANLVVGVGTASRFEDAQNVEKPTVTKEPRVR